MSTSGYTTLQKKFTTTDPEREARIRDEAIVDAYGDEEVAMSWYYYLDERLEFPFNVMVQTHKYRQQGGISYVSSQMRLLSMAPLKRCGMHQMWAMGMLLTGRETPFHILLNDIKSIEPNTGRSEALQDWMYWTRHIDFDLWELKK